MEGSHHVVCHGQLTKFSKHHLSARIISAKPFCFRICTTSGLLASPHLLESPDPDIATKLLQEYLATTDAARWQLRYHAENLNPSWFKNPFYVNPRTYTSMQFLQPTQREASQKTRFPHKLSGLEQLNPFGHSLRGAIAKHEPEQNKLD